MGVGLCEEFLFHNLIFQQLLEGILCDDLLFFKELFYIFFYHTFIPGIIYVNILWSDL